MGEYALWLQILLVLWILHMEHLPQPTFNKILPHLDSNELQVSQNKEKTFKFISTLLKTI